MKWVVLIGAAMVLSACAGQPSPSEYTSNGFFMGLWHGFSSPFALIGSIFDGSIRMYAFPNTGVGYDFGWWIGCGVWAGGAGQAV